jgi:hypothetical protein
VSACRDQGTFLESPANRGSFLDFGGMFGSRLQ